MTKAAEQSDYDIATRPREPKTRLLEAIRPFIAAIPPGIGHPIAAFAGELIYWVARRSRQAAISNISHVMGPGTPRRKLKRTVRHVFHNMMRNYYELCRAPDLSDATVDSMIDFDEAGWRRIQALHDSGRGVLLASAHFGSFDMVTQVLARHGLEITVLVSQISPPWLSDFISELRADRGVQLLLVDEADREGVNLNVLKQSIKLLRSNGVLGIVVDRNEDQKGVKIKFFGHDTMVAAGIAKMALRTNSPIVLGIARRLNTYRFSLTFEEPIEPVGSASNEEDVKALMTQVFSRVQYHISKNPEQWVLLQPVWPRTPEPEE